MNLSTNGRKAPKEDVYLPYVYTAIASCNEFENEWKYSFKYISKIKDYLDSREFLYYSNISLWASGSN